MTAAEAAKFMGRGAFYTPERSELSFRVVVRDVKAAYGHTRFLIGPEAGRGEKWVELTSLKLDTEKK